MRSHEARARPGGLDEGPSQADACRGNGPGGRTRHDAPSPPAHPGSRSAAGPRRGRACCPATRSASEPKNGARVPRRATVSTLALQRFGRRRTRHLRLPVRQGRVAHIRERVQQGIRALAGQILVRIFARLLTSLEALAGGIRRHRRRRADHPVHSTRHERRKRSRDAPMRPPHRCLSSENPMGPPAPTMVCSLDLIGNAL